MRFFYFNIFSIFVKNLIIMKISFILTIVGWCLFFFSLYCRTTHAEKVFKSYYTARQVAISSNLVSLLFFISSILLSLVFSKYNLFL